MATDRANDLLAFKGFIDEKLSEGGVETLDEALGLWECENQTSEERQATLDAIQEGLAVVEAGRTRPAHEVLAELRKKHNLPEPS